MKNETESVPKNARPLKVKVTKKCIDHALSKDSHRCMIADAVHQADPKAKYVSVDLQSIRWSNLETGERYYAFTPAKAQSKLLAFDGGHDVQPFEFTAVPVLTTKVGWQANHPKSSRKGKVYRKTGKKRKARVVKHREFGIRMYVEP